MIAARTPVDYYPCSASGVPRNDVGGPHNPIHDAVGSVISANKVVGTAGREIHTVRGVCKPHGSRDVGSDEIALNAVVDGKKSPGVSADRYIGAARVARNYIASCGRRAADEVAAYVSAKDALQANTSAVADCCRARLVRADQIALYFVAGDVGLVGWAVRDDVHAVLVVPREKVSVRGRCAAN